MKQNELLHYAAVYAALLLTWPAAMTTFNGNLAYTGIAVFAVFIAADKLAHNIFHLP